MSNKHNKLIEKLQRERMPRDIKFSEVESLIKNLGGTISQKGTSHTLIVLGNEQVNMSKSHGKNENTLKLYQVKDLINLLIKVGKIKDEN